MNDLSGKTAVITGATSGMGAASARRFAKAGAKVILIGRNEERGEKIVDELRKSSCTAEYFSADLSQKSEIERVCGQIREANRRIDILFNNAGIYPSTNPAGGGY